MIFIQTVKCRSPKPEARSPKPEDRSPKPEAEARSTKPEAEAEEANRKKEKKRGAGTQSGSTEQVSGKVYPWRIRGIYKVRIRAAYPERFL